MTSLNSDYISKLFGHGEQEPWDVFKELLTGNVSKKQNELKIKEGIDFYKKLYAVPITDVLEEKTHPKLEFMKDTIHGIIREEGEEPHLLFIQTEEQNDSEEFIKCKFDILMEITKLKRMYYCKFQMENKDSFTFSRELIKARKNWFTSVIQRIFRFKKEIDFYKEKGVGFHPIQKIVTSWNQGDKILVDEGEKQKILEKEKSVVPSKPVSGQEKVLPKREIKKTELPFKKKEEKPKFVLDKIPKFEFTNDTEKGGSKLLVL